MRYLITYKKINHAGETLAIETAEHVVKEACDLGNMLEADYGNCSNLVVVAVVLMDGF